MTSAANLDTTYHNIVPLHFYRPVISTEMAADPPQNFAAILSVITLCVVSWGFPDETSI